MFLSIPYAYLKLVAYTLLDMQVHNFVSLLLQIGKKVLKNIYIDVYNGICTKAFFLKDFYFAGLLSTSLKYDIYMLSKIC